MADDDPISDVTVRKRQKRTYENTYDSQDDSGDDLTFDDFNTVATLPITGQKRKLGYSASQFHADLGSKPSQQSHAHITQPTQPLASATLPQTHVTQPTQPLVRGTTSPSASEVLVGRSSPPAPNEPSSSPPRQQPAPIRRAPFAKPSILANLMAPPGTAYRRPVGVQPKPTVIDIDSDDDDDPPVQHSSDEEEETQSALKPTNFKPGGRNLGSTPIQNQRVVKESPRQDIPLPAAGSGSAFLNLMSEFAYGAKSNSNSLGARSLVNGHGRPQPSKFTLPTARSAQTAVMYRNVDDIDDYSVRSKVIRMLKILPGWTVQQCVDGLERKKGNLDDAVSWLVEQNSDEPPSTVSEEVDELTSQSPLAKRGVAISKVNSLSQNSQRPSAKQEVKVPTQTIAEKYRSTQANRRPFQQPRDAVEIDIEGDEDQIVKPKRRLLQGRKGGSRAPSRSPSPQLKRPQPLQRAEAKRAIVVSSDDEDSDSAVGQDEPEEEIVAETDHDRRLVKFFNECSVRDIVDLCNYPEDVVQLVLDQRPFDHLDEVRAVKQTSELKSGKKSKARPVGEKIVEICSEMRTGFDAIEELVDECERIAQPIQAALKNWGVGATEDGELQVMNLDDTHDSGIGTPASSPPAGGDSPRVKSSKKKGFLGQPQSMSSEVTLKDYQLVGLNWLNLLWSKKISCILADDMGLGKTCQIIAFLAHLQQQKVDGVHLVIVPGSTLENWLREFQRFAPQLDVRPYYGSQAERRELQYSIEEEFDIIDVVITTYDIAVKNEDNKFLRRSIDPLITIYDEAHVLRNTQTDRYRQLIRIPATFRVLLTGTPLQNNLQELMAILAFIMPELFDAKKAELQYIFKHKASTKDTDHAALLSSQRIARARAMITPFILRRKKHQVLDLPAKHRRVEYCDMTPGQAEYYADLMEEAQREYADRLEGTKRASTANKGGSTTLMAIREVAIHPLLRLHLYDDKKLDKIATELLKHEWADNSREKIMAYLKGEHSQSFRGGDFGMHKFCAERAEYLSKFMLKKRDWMDSGKVVKFAELVRGFAANGDRVLVFSQFTTLMDILEAVLDTLQIRFIRLDGSTDMQIRQELIDKYHNDLSIPVFMLSTKAGGAGINLACANKVIIFDSGFNPQDDMQAENRAHRVGQTREVEVVRLVTRHTIEEQIFALGESKLALDQRVAGDDDAAAAATAEKQGKKAVEEMFVKSLQEGPKQQQPSDGGGDSLDLKDAFKAGLQLAGVEVKSKQAAF